LTKKVQVWLTGRAFSSKHLASPSKLNVTNTFHRLIDTQEELLAMAGQAKAKRALMFIMLG